MLVMLQWVLYASGVRLFLFHLLPPLPFLHSTLRGGLLGVVCLLVLVGCCIWWWFMGFKALPLIREKLALTEALLDAVFCELAAVSRGQPCLIFGYLNMEPTRIPCLAERYLCWFMV